MLITSLRCGKRDKITVSAKIKGMTNTPMKIGKLGESIALRFLESKNYSLLDRNFRRKWGELDLVVKKDEQIVFVEVKTVSCFVPGGVPREGEDKHRPEDKVGVHKRDRLRRIIQTYLGKFSNQPTNWRVDLICVYLDKKRERSEIKWLENIIV